MRIHLSRQRLLLVVGLLGLATLAVFWTQRGSLSEASAQPPAGTAAPDLKAPESPTSSSDYSVRAVGYIYETVPITREELGEYLIARVGSERLPNLVNRRIIEHACQQKGIDVTAAEIEADFVETVKGLNVSAADFVSRILKPYNKTLYEWKEDVIRPRLLLTKLCRDRVHVTDEDLRLAFEAHYGERVQCRMIMWDRQLRERVFQKIYPKIRDSEPEFELEATHQASPNLAAQGGRITPIGRHTTGNEELEKAAFALHPGDVSRVLAVPEGLVVLKCDKRLPPETTVKLEAVRDTLYKEVFEKKLQMEIPKQFEELKKLAQPKLFLKHAETEEELLREARKELQSDLFKPESAGRTSAHGN